MMLVRWSYQMKQVDWAQEGTRIELEMEWGEENRQNSSEDTTTTINRISRYVYSYILLA